MMIYFCELSAFFIVGLITFVSDVYLTVTTISISVLISGNII